jgi:hypothetical protein
MRYTTLLARAALALALPLILAHCADLQSTRQPLTYDAKSVGGPNSGAPLRSAVVTASSLPIRISTSVAYGDTIVPPETGREYMA